MFLLIFTNCKLCFRPPLHVISILPPVFWSILHGSSCNLEFPYISPERQVLLEHPDLQTWQRRNAHSINGIWDGWGDEEWSPNTLETSKDLCSSYLSSCAESQLQCMASLDEVPRFSSAAHGLHCSLAFGLFITPVRIESTSPALHGAFSTTGLPGKTPLLQLCPLSRTSPSMLWIKPMAHQHIFKTSC